MPEQEDVQAAIASLGSRYELTDGQQAALVELTERLAADPHAPTAIKAPREIVDAHLADSLSALDLDVVLRAGRLADIGAGAGVPGLVLAIALPRATVQLVESQARKCAYIETLIADLGIANAEPVCARVEEWVGGGGHGSQDVVTARAVGPQPVVLEYAAPLLALRGTLVDWRGRRDDDGEDAALRAAAELGLRRDAVVKVVPFAGARDRHLHLFAKIAPTPARFPRRAGIARKRPLGAAAHDR